MSRTSDGRHGSVRGAVAGCGDLARGRRRRAGAENWDEGGGGGAAVMRLAMPAARVSIWNPNSLLPTSRSAMTEPPISRRDWIKTVGVVGAGAIVASDAVLAETPGSVTPATPPAPAGSARRDRRARLDERDLRPGARAILPEVQLRLSRAVGRVRRLPLRIPRLHGREHIRARPFRASRRGKRGLDAHHVRSVRLGGRAGDMRPASSKRRFVEPARRSSGTRRSRWAGRSRRSRRSFAACRAARCPSAAAVSLNNRTTARAWSAIRSAAAISTRRAAWGRRSS